MVDLYRKKRFKGAVVLSHGHDMAISRTDRIENTTGIEELAEYYRDYDRQYGN